MDSRMVNRSIWLSGNSWVPAAPTGFWVAMTVKGWGDGMGLTVHGDLPLLHGLQEGGLGAGGGPVQLVRQEQVTQHRPRLIGHGPGLLIVNGVSGYV